MQISKKILQGVLLGLSTISLATAHPEAAAQATRKVPEKKHQQKDTMQINCPKPNPDPHTINQPQSSERPRVVQATQDSTELIYKHPCITCGRG